MRMAGFQKIVELSYSTSMITTPAKHLHETLTATLLRHSVPTNILSWLYRVTWIASPSVLAPRYPDLTFQLAIPCQPYDEAHICDPHLLIMLLHPNAERGEHALHACFDVGPVAGLLSSWQSPVSSWCLSVYRPCAMAKVASMGTSEICGL